MLPLEVLMRIVPADPTIHDFWKIYPVRIPGESRCESCREDTVLVQSMTGGFVTRNCPRCNHSDTLPQSVFRALRVWVACPECKRRMSPEVLPDKNYGFICTTCSVAFPLFALLPRYQDL